MVRVVVVFCLAWLTLDAKEVFKPEHILRYLTDDNPYYYAHRADYYSTKTKERISQSAFDTNLNAMYETKEYPLTTSNYTKAGVAKNLYNGVELSLAYRDAQGTQEFNNIKTAQEGEMLASIKLPLLSIINNTSKEAIAYEVAKLQTDTMKYKTQSKVTQFYLEISYAYYELLYENDFLKLTKELLLKSEKRFAYIKKEVAVGKLPRMALLDVKSQLISRQQIFNARENSLRKKLNQFVRYFNISLATFNKEYTLPPLQSLDEKLLKKETYLKQAQAQRVELKKIAYEQKKLYQQKKGNTLERFPKLDVKISGVHDFYEQSNGYKVSANFLFPLQRRKYEGKKEFLQKETLRYESLKVIFMNNIGTNITVLMQSIQTAQKNMLLSKEEVSLREILESAEARKLKEGLSNLVFMNQREIASLTSKQKLLFGYLTMQKLYLQLQYEVGLQLFTKANKKRI